MKSEKAKKIFQSRKTKLAAAIVIALAVVVFWHQFRALAQSLIDSFADTSRVAKTWNVTVTPGTGVQLTARSCDSSKWDCSLNNLCLDTLGDGTYIIPATADSTGTQWKNVSTSCTTPQCAANGSENDLVADNTVNFANYPARSACQLMGGRLPTLAELQCMYTNRATFGGFGTDYYWSSTEASTTYATSVYFSNGSTSNYFKTSTYSVRCVKGW
ncbi:MAG: DUF1566 domain-containing protein [Candidatus Pacebacteria bacterium]|nr:DUF1566 domain-containing protein [Candidatus Paceibacterota bacterium]